MNCCVNCFNDVEIKAFIYSNSSGSGVGKCDFCNASNTPLVNCRELDESLRPLISLFQVGQINSSESRLIHQQIQEAWGLFNVLPDVASTLLKAIFLPINDGELELFEKPVEIKILSNGRSNSDIHSEKWESFADEIKTKNRYFLGEKIDFLLLEELISFYAKVYNKGKRFYRARISEKTGHPISKMGKPPAENATAGRANPYGIPYLYVSGNVDTCLYECRATYLDFITVASVKLNEDLKIVSLYEIASASPIKFGEQLEHYLLHQKYLRRLEEELSRPLRRFEKELDYLPSQYLCEFVKSLGYDAIEYGSSLYGGGINLAVFNDDKLSIEDVSVFEINSVDLKFNKIS